MKMIILRRDNDGETWEYFGEVTTAPKDMPKDGEKEWLVTWLQRRGVWSGEAGQYMAVRATGIATVSLVVEVS